MHDGKGIVQDNRGKDNKQDNENKRQKQDIRKHGDQPVNDKHVQLLSRDGHILPCLTIEDEHVSWYCPGGEEDEQCGLLNTALLDELVYQEAAGATKPGKGAMIALPRCQCGAQTFLKADYTLKELHKTLQVVEDPESGAVAYVMPLRYVNNLHIHVLLHKAGKAAHAPVLDMPPQELLDHPGMAGAKQSTIHALWLGYSVMRQYKPKELTTQQVLMLE